MSRFTEPSILVCGFLVGAFIVSPAIARVWRYGQKVQRRRAFVRADRRVLDGLAKIGQR